MAEARFEELDDRMAAVCRYALKLTVAPSAITESDIEDLRAAGLDDRAIVDANQVVSYFNYVNRVVEGLGVELEESWPSRVRMRRHYDIGVRRTGPAV